MKHLPHLIAALALLSGVLAACGGGGNGPERGPVTDTLPPPNPVLAAPSAAQYPGTLAGLRWDSTAAPPSAVAGAVAQLDLEVDGDQATVCQYGHRLPVCAVVQVPVPAGTQVRYTVLPDGTELVAYVASGSAPIDPAAARAFQAAFNGAARAVEAYGLAHSRNDDTDCSEALVVGNPTRAHDCGPVVEVPGNLPGGAGGAPIGGSPGPGAGPGDAPDGAPMQKVYIPAPPDPINTIVDVVTIVGRKLGLLNRTQRLIAAAPDRCVDSGFVRVCIRGKRPPVVEPDDPVWQGPAPWFPQWACNLWGALCSEGQEQEPRDNPRLPGSETRGKTKAELDEICVNNNIAEHSQCQAIYGSQRKWRELRMCKEEADDRMFTCFKTADQLTNFGEHRAP